MRFHGPKGRCEVTLVGSPSVGPYRWCPIRVAVDEPGGAWSAESHCLLVEEIVELADWLDSAAATPNLLGKFKVMTLDNMINFELLGLQPRRLRIYLEWELRPLKQKGLLLEEFYREYPVTADGLRHAATSLRKELSQVTKGRHEGTA